MTSNARSYNTKYIFGTIIRTIGIYYYHGIPFSNELSCPVCRRSHRLPESGIVGLPVNFAQADVQAMVLEEQGLPPMERSIVSNGNKSCTIKCGTLDAILAFLVYGVSVTNGSETDVIISHVRISGIKRTDHFDQFKNNF